MPITKPAPPNRNPNPIIAMYKKITNAASVVRCTEPKEFVRHKMHKAASRLNMTESTDNAIATIDGTTDATDLRFVGFPACAGCS